MDIEYERIAAGAYQEYLPKAEILAAEFSVNVKTMNKAIGQLVQQQLVERKRHIGTRILRQENIARGDQAVEIIFEGFTIPDWLPL